MFGIFLPVLFPITLFGIFNKYFMEKLLITYYYRQPPQYNQMLSKTAIMILKSAPIYMFVLGYWAIGNVQLFKNITRSEMANKDDQTNPNHNLFNFD